MSSCNKTPVAVLHELCVRRNIVEQYNLVATHGTPNDRIFEMSVETDTGILARGSGKTKKEAKHNAAQAALNKLKVPAITSGVQMPGGLGNASVVNPHEGKGLTGNSVGRLQDYCAINGLPAPKYDLTGDEGEPHERTFSMKCEVSQRYEMGIGRTKQLAKHNAAQAMYEALTNNPSLCMRDRLPTGEANHTTRSQNSTSLSQKEKESMIELYSSTFCTNVPSTNLGLKFSEYYKSMETTIGCIQDDLFKESFPSPMEELAALVEKLSLTLSFHEARDTAEGSKEGKCFVYAVVNTQPTTVQIGKGESDSAAREDAALCVIKYWRNFVDFHPVI